MAEGGGKQQQQANQAPGYSYEFIEKVPEDYYCFECKLVAKDLTFTSCCGETFCLECIEKYKQEGKPCPSCDVEGVIAQKQVKYQQRIRRLSVACELKDRGCEWKGALEQMDAHLDPALDNCQYVDIPCPLNCLQAIPKNKMEDHLKNLCVKRDFFCQYCNYKASYEEVKNVHLEECRFFPLQCPNRCGVTCEREDMEDHLNICRLQEIECEFANIGCNEKFCREDMTQHMDDNSFRHLMLVALHSRKSKEDFEEKMKEFTGKMDEVTKEKDELKGKMEAQQKEHEDLLGKMEVQQKKHEELQGKMEAQQKMHEEEKETLAKLLKNENKKAEDLKGKLSELETKFENFSNQHGVDEALEKHQEVEELVKDQKGELLELKERAKISDELNKNLQDRLSNLEKEILERKNQISKQKSALEDQKKEFDKKIKEAKEKCNQLETNMKKGEGRLDNLLKHCGDLDRRCEELEAYKEVSATNVEKLEQKIKTLTTQRDGLLKEVKELSKKTDENEKQTALHQEGIKTLQAKKPDNSLKEIEGLKTLMDHHVKTFVPKVNAISEYLGNFERTFEMENFTVEKRKNKARDWKSPAMYTHMCGYKFCIGLDANGRGGSQGEAIYAELYVMPGDFDSLLRWPAKASFTLELIHRRGGKNVKYNTAMKKWDKPELNFKCLSVFPYTEVNNSYCFLEHSKLEDFLEDDTLKFCTSVTLH